LNKFLPFCIVLSLSFFLFENVSFSQTENKRNGTLMIIGGGGTADSLYHIFGALAGGKDQSLVIIPTAMSDEGIAANTFKERFSNLGFTNIQVVHTRDKAMADTPEHLNSLRQASAVYFSGGDQSRIADAFLGTRVHEELKKLLERGGVIMGTSAGATIMGTLLIGGDARAFPNINIPYPPALDLLPQTVIDQHVLKRNRQFDLIPVLEAYPHLLGIALDEQTAIIVKDQKFRVWGPSYVLVYDPNDWQMQLRKTGKINKPFYMLSKGQQFDLVTRKLIK
jgi:cyanophycinase